MTWKKQGPPVQNGKHAGKARWIVGGRTNGKSWRQTFYDETQADRYVEALESGKLTAGTRTVADLADVFLVDYCPDRMTLGTVADYQSIIRHHIKPAIGNVRCADLQFEHIEALMRHVRTVPVPPRTKPAGAWYANKVRAIARLICRYGIRKRWMHSNPVEVTDPMKARKRQPVILSASELQRLLTACEPPFKAPITLATYTGARIGEILGLTWGALRFPEREIVIARTWSKGVEGKPKTEAGERTLPMVEPVYTLLRELAAEAGAVKPTDWLFADRRGKPMDSGKLLRQGLRPALKRAGLPTRMRTHDLRHNAATLLALTGADPKTIQSVLGHSTPHLAMQVYIHARHEAVKLAADAMAAQLTEGAEKKAAP